MSLFKKKKAEVDTAPAVDTAAMTEEEALAADVDAADVDAVMRKYDRESATRIWEGTPKIVVRWISAIFSLYCIYMTLCSTAIQEVRLSAFMGCIMLLG
ncbi:MAG: hypothetical protein IKL23_07555, partial [Oscillospiraceae bacterium]|nr:hypothetical protein [Oscillospiraceae bacterium]